MKIHVLSGSARAQSLNTRLARLVAAARPDDDVVVDAGLDRLPFYHGDVEAAGAPAEVAALRDAVAGADLLVVVTPEYNGTAPGVLANAVDWLSRPYRDSVLVGKPVVVLSASSGRGGGRGAAEHLRVVLARTGARVSPAGLSVALAETHLDAPELPGQLAEVLSSGAPEVVGAAA